MYNYDFLKKELNLPYSEEKIKALFKEAKANLDKADKIETAEYQNATAITETRGEDSKKIFKFDDGTVKIVESGWDERVAAYNTEGRKVFENTGACENYYSSDNSRLSFNEKCAELGFAKKDKIESLIFPKGNNAQEFIYEISSDRPTLFEGENAKFIQNDDLQKKLQVHFKDNKITSFKMILELEKAEYIDKTVFENVVVNYSNNHIDMYLEKETDYPKHGYMGSLKNITEKTKLSKTGEMVTTVTTIDNTVKPVRERVEVVKESPYSEKAKKYKLLQPKMDEMLMEDFKKLEPFINLQSDYPNPEKKQQLCRNFFSEKISSISDVVKMCNAPEETLENEKNPLPLPPKLGKRVLSPVYLINKAKQKQ